MNAKIDEATFFFLLPLTSESKASLLFLPLHPLSFHSLRCDPLWPWFSLHLSSTPPLSGTNTDALLLHTTWVSLPFPPSVFLLLSCSFVSLYTLLVDVGFSNEGNTTTVKETEREEGGGCDVFRGRWVRDELTRPLYEESDCPYIQPQLTCQEHGRPEKEYQRWRWQPHGCDLPT